MQPGIRCTRAALTCSTQHQHNTSTSSSPKAQGKGLMRLGLTGSLLRMLERTLHILGDLVFDLDDIVDREDVL
jgi:hypothetical protein